MREPRGVVVWEEETVERSDDLVLVIEGVWDMEGRLERGLAVEVEGDCGAGEEQREELRVDSRLSLLMLGSKEGLGAVASVTIFIPLLVLVLAGMNKVCCLFAAGTAIR